MSLNKALIDESSLRQYVQNGCGAVAGEHRGLITDELKQTVLDSLNLDVATSAEHPGANRWDYILAVRRRNTLVGVEPHSARDDEIGTVIAKKQHSSRVLRSHLKNDWRVSAWIWVSSGKVKFSKMDPAIRRLDQNGIRFAGRIVRSFES